MRAWPITFALLGACTPTELEPEVEPAHREPALVVEAPASRPARELGPLLGGRVEPRLPTPGRWASRMNFDQHRYITTEHTIESSIQGSAVLHLSEDGRAEACFATKDFSASAMSHYQARDGKDHFDSSDHAMVVGMTGTWKPEADAPQISVRFDRAAWRTCEVDPTTEPFEQPAMHCFQFAANDKVPRDALLCQVPEDLRDAAKLSLLIGDSPRAGSWHHRHDPGHGVEPPADAKPWLLLGADPGLELRAEDHDRDAKPLTIELAAVPDPTPLADP